MRNLFLVSDEQQLTDYKDFLESNWPLLQDYLEYLQLYFQVEELPQAIIWTDEEAATRYIRECPIPACTNDVRMVMTPDLHVWKNIYLKQVESYSVEDSQEIVEHYHSLSTNFLLQIIGHELAHQSECFLDYDVETMWFEEGMVEYISRRYFLTDEEYIREKQINQQLVQLFQSKNGYHHLSQFGQATYDRDYASIFYEYWRSFLAIDLLVESFGTVEDVFYSYHDWHDQGRPVDLLTWFQLEI
ncbi:elongation factor Tu [Streptococcus suis]|nr:elongation factor Tu [Streptococcus suis]